MEKQAIIAALREFVNQRPGLEWANYGEASSYRAEMRQIMRDRKDAHLLLNACGWRDSITAQMMLDGFEAFSGRLTISEDAKGRVKLDYCTGQYYPTEYRKAVCAVAASVLWDYTRENMPSPDGKITRTTGFGPFKHESEHDNINGMTPGDWMRKTLRAEFGRGIGSRWFN